MSEELKYPEDLKYSKEHEWVKVDGDTAIVGISDFAQAQLTDVVFVELPAKDSNVEQDKQMCTIESVKSVSDVFSPVSGTIIEVNTDLESQPELINTDPYEKGYLCKVKLSDKAELDNLMSAVEYKKFVSESDH